MDVTIFGELPVSVMEDEKYMPACEDSVFEEPWNLCEPKADRDQSQNSM